MSSATTKKETFWNWLFNNNRSHPIINGSLGYDLQDSEWSWIDRNTAILVIHGVGQQRALETLDAFATNLIQAMSGKVKKQFVFSHMIKCGKDDQAGGVWFDNFVRIKEQPTTESTTESSQNSPYLDIHEYYWAYQTENKASFSNIQSWIRGVVRGAKQFYLDNAALASKYEDKNGFFTKKEGNKTRFNFIRYKAFLYLAGIIIPLASAVSAGILHFIGKIPTFGEPFEQFAKWIEKNLTHNMNKVMGDLAIYNTSDEKSEFNLIRRKILNGAVQVLQGLIQPTDDPEVDNMYSCWEYDRVIVAGHSLGSEIGYDAINRINALVTLGEIKGCNREGVLQRTFSAVTGARPSRINELIAGFLTFGSPLDKVAFFLRDQAPKNQILREQILTDFYGFRQKIWAKGYTKELANGQRLQLTDPLPRFFEGIPWRNYFDQNDPVSGSLDFYSDVTNVECRFPARFTHTYYWTCQEMYEEVYLKLVLQ